LITPLFYSLLFATYSQSVLILAGLNTSLGIESTQSPGALLASVLAEPAPNASGYSHGNKAGEKAGFVERWVTPLGEGFENLWNQEKLGFLAISLAFLEGSFGLVLLWGLGRDRPLRVGLISLFRERPMLTAAFVGMNIALILLAINRGSELSGGSSPLLSAIISGLIELVMGWILVLTQHYAFECAADSVGLARTLSLTMGMTVTSLLTMSIWSSALLVVLAAIGLSFGAFFLFYILAAGYLRFAKAMGEFVRMVAGLRWAGAAPVHLGSALPVTAVSICLVLGGYYLLRGIAR
jgi:hypothetical protein